MKRVLCILMLACLTKVSAFASYDTLSISSGYNADVIANGVGTAAATTTNDVDGVNYAYVSNGWQLNATSIGITTGLPADGLVNSQVASTTGLQYQLADYNSNNSLRLPSNNNGTLNLQTPVPAQTLYILAVSGSGTSTMTVTVNFSDGTTQSAASIVVADWYGGSGIALNGFQRVNLSNNQLDGTTLGPNLYQYSVSISTANQTKSISSVKFDHTSGTGVLNIFALSIEESAVTCAQPTALAASNSTSTSADLGWTEAGSATQWQISYGAPGFTADNGTKVITSTNPKSITGLLAASNYEFYVRAICGPGDTSLWSGPKSFSTDCGTPPTISATSDAERCGKGTITLSAHASSGVVRWYEAATGGTVIDTGVTFTTPSLTSTKTYYVAAAAHYQANCETSTRQAVVATVNDLPQVDLGKDTTICPGVTLLLDAGNPGATHSWNTGASSQSIQATAAGTYIATVTDAQNCSGNDTIILSPGMQPVNNMADSTSLCSGDTIILDAGNPGCVYSWNTGEDMQIIETGSGGAFSVTITSTDECSITASTFVIARSLPVVDLGIDTAICNNTSIILDAQNAGASYIWNTGDTTQVVHTVDSGNYSVQVTDQYGCQADDTLNLGFLTEPHADGFNFIPLFYEELGKVAFSIVNPQDVQSCSWNFGDGSPVSSDFNPTHTFPVNGGSFDVTLTVNNICGSYSVSLAIQIDTKTGIVKVVSRDQNLKVYPNPAKNQLFVASEKQNKIESIQLYDFSGRLVRSIVVNNETQVQIDTKNLPAGNYMLRVQTRLGWENQKIELIR